MGGYFERGANMAGIDPADIIRKTFLAGVGAVATGAEKSQEIVAELVKKGELTVEQGKALNEELSHKVADAVSDPADALLKSRLQNMTAEERAAYAQKVADMAADIDAEAETVDVEAEVVEPEVEDAE